MGLFPLIDQSPYVDYNLWEKEIAWMIVCILAAVILFIFFKRASGVKESSIIQYHLFKSMGLFSIGYTIARIFFIFSDFARWNEGESPLYVRFVMLSYLAMFIFSSGLVSIVEKSILQWKKSIAGWIFRIMSVVVVILLIFSEITLEYLNIIRLVIMILAIMSVFILLYIFGFLIKNSTGTLRVKAIYTFIGILLIVVGNVLDSELIIQSLNIPIWMPSLFPMLGFLLIVLFQKPGE